MAVFVCSGNAWAETPRAEPQDPQGSEAPVLLAGAYQGVTLEGGSPPPQPPPAEGLQAITWPGFRLADGRAEVFLQLTGPVAYKVRQSELRVRILLEGVAVQLRNNLEILDTRHFPGPVASARLRPRKKGQAQLEITLKQAAKPRVATTTADGYTYLVVSFPAKRAAE